MEEPKIEELLVDSLSASTKVVRKNLLKVSAISFLAVGAELAPIQISAFGISLILSNQVILLITLCMITLYLLVAFTVYAMPDFFIWKSRILDYKEREGVYVNSLTEEDYQQQKISGVERPKWLYPKAHCIANYRAFFEYCLPVIFGFAVILCLIYRIC